jgi:hypothetical protein
VNTLKRFGTNNDVGDGSAIVENEDRVVAAGVLVGVASLTTVELLVLEVLSTTNDAGSWERDDGAGAGGNVESLRSGHAGDEREECDFGNHGENGWSAGKLDECFGCEEVKLKVEDWMVELMKILRADVFPSL